MQLIIGEFGSISMDKSFTVLISNKYDINIYLMLYIEGLIVEYTVTGHGSRTMTAVFCIMEMMTAWTKRQF